MKYRKNKKFISCSTCGEIFKRIRKNTRYCSRSCRPSSHPQMYCIVCGKDFMSTNRVGTAYCSQPCRTKKLGEVGCAVCKKIFNKNSKNQKYCSSACSKEGQLLESKFYKLRFAVLIRDGFRCHYCGAAPHLDPNCVLHIDHIKPRYSGGGDRIDNLITACKVCNLGKGRHFDTTEQLETIKNIYKQRSLLMSTDNL